MEEHGSASATSNYLIYHSTSQNNFYSKKPIKVPTLDEIARLTGALVHSKKSCPETFPPAAAVKSHREIKLPRIQLVHTKKMVNQPLWFNNDEEMPLELGSTRFTSRPHDFLDSSKKIFPTGSLQFHKMPTTTSDRFCEIDLKQDLKLANFAVSSENAFKTEWQKHSTLKNRKLFPEKHPEFVAHPKENNIRRDKIVDYREAMLKVKAMMNKAWGVKK